MSRMAWLTTTAFALLSACTQTGGNDQAANENLIANARAPEVDAANVSNAEETFAPGESASTGMPVPGTNTAEHIVVNSDENEDTNTQDMNHE